MTKILNLDDLAKIEKTICIAGQEYPVVEMSVADFIDATKDAEALVKSGDDGTITNLEATIRMLRRSIPSLPEEKIRALSLGQLKVLIAFVQGEIEDAKEGAPEGNAQTE
jgi:hypothetical protein